jgi:hypothetical protein
MRLLVSQLWERAHHRAKTRDTFVVQVRYRCRNGRMPGMFGSGTIVPISSTFTQNRVGYSVARIHYSSLITPRVVLTRQRYFRLCLHNTRYNVFRALLFHAPWQRWQLTNGYLSYHAASTILHIDQWQIIEHSDRFLFITRSLLRPART